MEVDAVASASGTTETRIVFGGQYEAGAGALSLIMLPAEVMQQVSRPGAALRPRSRHAARRGVALTALRCAALRAGQVQADPTTTLKFIGRDGEDAVLVTATRTYAVRKGETSNAQLLLPSSMDSLVHRTEGAGDGETTGTAVANVMEHYELHPTGARLRMLPGVCACCGERASAARQRRGQTRTRTQYVCTRVHQNSRVHANELVYMYILMQVLHLTPARA
jgi:hypothetical protein